MCYNPNMSLELNKLLKEVDALGSAAAQRAAELAGLLPKVSALLASLGVADELLRQKIEKAGERWPGASPAS